MMKKIFKCFGRISLIFLLMTPYILEPLNVYAASKATTLSGLRKELSDLQAQKKQSQDSISSTQSAINKKNNEVANAYSEIEKAENEIASAKNQIEESNKNIENLKVKTSELLGFYELMNNNDSYMEYVTGASTMTELLMRMDAVNALLDYNNNNITNLENLIDQNEKLQIDLLTKQDELESNIETYKSKISSLINDLSNLLEISMDIDDQINAQKNLIQFYSSIGCKEDQDLEVCLNASNNASWLKPLNKGRITSLWGYRISPITKKTSFHNGIDIGGNNEGTNIYAVGSGTVAVVIKKSSCGGNQVYINVQIAGIKYTVMYAHMLSINVKVGDKVTSNTVIGYVGGGSGTRSWDSCSTGAHLHFSVSKGFYTSYSKFVSGQINPPGFPGKGSWFYSRTQWF